MRELSWFDKGEGADEPSVRTLEDAIGFKFPPDFREFLIQYAGFGNPDEHEFKVMNDRQTFVANFGNMLSVKNAPGSIRAVMNNLGDQLLPGIIPIIGTGMGDLVCLDFRNEKNCSVVYFNQSAAREKSIIPLAHNFTIFLEMLQAPQDDEE
jgi:cell wall assembly regulator SMI1